MSSNIIDMEEEIIDPALAEQQQVSTIFVAK
jgi:hypothetical protein